MLKAMIWDGDAVLDRDVREAGDSRNANPPARTAHQPRGASACRVLPFVSPARRHPPATRPRSADGSAAVRLPFVRPGAEPAPDAGTATRRDVLPLLRAVKAAGLMQGIASTASRDRCDAMLRVCLRAEGSTLFDVVLAAEDVRVRKPAPEVYRILLDRLGLAARDCLAVEDSFAGALAAGRAGIPCVLTRAVCRDRGVLAGLRARSVLAVLDEWDGAGAEAGAGTLLDPIRRWHAVWERSEGAVVFVP